MALGNDLDSKIVEIYQEYLKHQKDEKVENRVYATEESFRNGLEEVIKLNGIVDRSEFYTAIAFEIQNGNFSISNDGKIDLSSESITKAVERAKAAENKKSKQTTKVEENGISTKSEQYKDLLGIKEVTTLEEAKRLVSLDVPNEVYDSIPDDVKKQAYEMVLEEIVGEEYAAPLAEIAVEAPKEPPKIEDSEYKKYFDDSMHEKAFKGFIKSGDFLRFADMVKEKHPELQGLTLDNIGERLEDGAKLFAIVLLLRKAEDAIKIDNTSQTGKKEEIDPYLKTMMRLSELTDEQMELYKKLSPLYTRGDNKHDGRFVGVLLSKIKEEQNKEMLRKVIIDEIEREMTFGRLKKSPELTQAVEALIENPNAFIELAEKTIEKTEQMEQSHSIYKTYGDVDISAMMEFVDKVNYNRLAGLNPIQYEQALQGGIIDKNIYSSNGAAVTPIKESVTFSDFIRATDVQVTPRDANGYTISMGIMNENNAYSVDGFHKRDKMPGIVATFDVSRQFGSESKDFLANSYTGEDKNFNPLTYSDVKPKMEKMTATPSEPVEDVTEINGLDDALDATMSGSNEMISDIMFADMFAGMAEDLVFDGSTEVEHERDEEGEMEAGEDVPPVSAGTVPSGMVAEEVIVDETASKVNETTVPPVTNGHEVIEEPKAPEQSDAQPSLPKVITFADKIKKGLNDLGKKAKGIFEKIAGLFGGGNNDAGNNTGTTGTGGIAQDTKEPKSSQTPGQDFIQHVDLNFDYLKNNGTESRTDPIKPKGVDDQTQGFEVDDD